MGWKHMGRCVWDGSVWDGSIWDGSVWNGSVRNGGVWTEAYGRQLGGYESYDEMPYIFVILFRITLKNN